MNKVNIEDSSYEKLLHVISHYMMAEMEEITPFNSKTDSEKEELIKIALKAIETSTIILHEFLKPDALDFEKLDKASNMIKDGKYDDAYGFIFTNSSSESI